MILNGKVIKNPFEAAYNRLINGVSPDDNKLSLKELTNELKDAEYRKIQKKAIDFYLNKYVNENNIPNEYRNALRHRGGSLLMAKNLDDSDKSHLWGNIKEFSDLLTGHDSKIGSAIDAQNNYIGRKLYNKYKDDNLTYDELMSKVVDSIKIYNPDETNFQKWEIKESQIPMQGMFNAINTITRPLNQFTKKSR